MYPPTFSPELPIGLAFDIPDHLRASQWAMLHGYRLVIELDYGVGNEEYEEVLAFYAGAPSQRLWCLLWRQVDGFVMQPVVGRARRFESINDALHALKRRQR